MTHPGGSSGVNLATLWVPVMPETSQMDAKMREAGAKGKRAFEQGFGSGGGPEELGATFAQKFSASFASKLGSANLGLGVGTAIDKLSEQVDAKLAAKLKASLPQAYKSVTTAQNELTEAHGRGVRAEQELTAAMEGGFNKASIVIPIRQRLTQAHNDEAEATKKVSAAQQNYTNILEQHNQASRAAFTTSSAFAGMMGGAMVLGIQAVVSGMENLIELGAHVFEEAVHGAEEFVDKLIDIGQEYQHLNIQVSEFSNASGAALEGLQASAAKVFSGLDVAGKDTGQTLATFAQRLGLSGDELERLTTHVERLEGRFANLKADDLAAAFSALNVSGKDAADNTLASWVESARAAGVSAGTLINQLGTLGETLRPEITGLNADQLGAWLAQMTAKGPGAQRTVVGLSHAEEIFAKNHLTFAQGLQEAAKEINAATNEADKEEIAEKLFGARNWSSALDMVRTYLDVLNKGPAAYQSNGDALDALLEQWSDLSTKVDEFKHKIEGLAAPFATQATKAVEGGLDKVSGWFDKHHVEIIEKIRGWGHTFIDTLPNIQEFAATAVDLLGPFLTVMKGIAVTAMNAAGAFLILSTHVKDGLAMFHAAGKLMDVNFDDLTTNAAEKIRGIKIPFDDLNDSIDNAADAAQALGQGISNLPPGPPGMPLGGTGKGWWWGTQGLTAGPGLQGGGGSFGPPASAPAGPAPSAGTPSAPQPFPLAPPGATGLPGGGFRGLFPGTGYSGGVDWADIAQAESGGNWTIDHGLGPDVTGAFQIATGTWLSHGGGQYAPKAYLAPPEAQLAVAQAILADPSQGPGAWPETYKNHPDWFGSYASQRPVGAQTGGMAGFDSGGQPGMHTNWLAKIGHSFPGIAKGIGHGIRGAYRWLGPKATEWEEATAGLTAPLWDRPGWNPSKMPSKEIEQETVGEISGDPSKPGGGGKIKAIKEDATHGVSKQFLHQLFDLVLEGGEGGLAESGAGFQGGGRGPKDTVPVWVTPNEYIWNEEAVSKYGPLIHGLNEKAQGRGSGVSSMFRNAKGFGQGGDVGGVSQVIWSDLEDPTVQASGGDAGMGLFHGSIASGGPGSTYSDETNPPGQGFSGHHGHVHTTFNRDPFTGQPYGITDQNTTLGDWSAFPPWVHQLGDMYGLDAKTYTGHQVWDGLNHGIDWYPRGKQDMSGQSYSHADNAILNNFASAATAVGSGKMAGFTGGSTPLGASGGTGGAQLTGWGGPGSVGPGGTPGLPGQYGGYGAYGGETQDQAYQRMKAVRDANDRIGDLGKEIDRKKADIGKLQKEYDDLNSKQGLLREQDKVDAKKQELDQAKDDLNKLQTRELPDAQEAYGEAQRRQQEAALKPPSGAAGEDKAGAAEKEFGSKFLGGIAQSLGFPDVFGGKAPWDFGAVKMLGRFATGFMGGLQKEGQGQMGGGGTGYGGMPGMGGMPGLGSFALGLGGINIPKSVFQGGAPQTGGPGTVPFDPTGQNAYATAGAPPGPVQANYHVGDVNWNINPSTDPNLVSGVQSFMNSLNTNNNTIQQPGMPTPPTG